MNVYADSSFFVSLYLLDKNSMSAREQLRGSADRLWLTPLHRAEWTHAVAQHVFRSAITSREAQQVYRQFERDDRAGVWAKTALPETVFETCTALAHKHVAHFGTRTLDTLHVATAVDLGATSFWTFDERQAKLAKAVGLVVN